VVLASTAFRFLLGFVFVVASIPKLAAQADFVVAVENYRLVPLRAARAVARLLPVGELLCGLSLLSGTVPPATAFITALMLAAFAVAIAMNLFRGRAIECGCTGTAGPRQIGWSLVARDTALAAIAVVVVLEPSGPSLWQLAGSSPTGPVSPGTAAALALAAAVAVVAEGLTVDVVRARRAISAFNRARATGGLI
jgi:hypothetical protein